MNSFWMAICDLIAFGKGIRNFGSTPATRYQAWCMLVKWAVVLEMEHVGHLMWKMKQKKPITPNVLISRVVECQSICNLPTINTYTPTSAPSLWLAELEMREGETTTRCNRPRRRSTTPIRWTDLLVRQPFCRVQGVALLGRSMPSLPGKTSGGEVSFFFSILFCFFFLLGCLCLSAERLKDLPKTENFLVIFLLKEIRKKAAPLLRDRVVFERTYVDLWFYLCLWLLRCQEDSEFSWNFIA